MARPVLTICVRCEHGEDLHRRVRALRKQRRVKELFKVEEARCLGLCDSPCAIKLEGKKRSTYQRVCLHPLNDVEQLVAVAIAYAALAPGQELAERSLPGDHED